MRRLITIMLLFSSAISAQDAKVEPGNQNRDPAMKDSISNEVVVLIEVTDRLTEFMIERDLVGLDQLLDDDFTLTHITGYVQSKEEWLDEIETKSMKYYSYEEVNRTVNIQGNKAEVIQQNHLDARIWGARNVWPLQQVFSLEKRDGEWIFKSSVASTF